jgi:hypothetical protein
MFWIVFLDYDYLFFH